MLPREIVSKDVIGPVVFNGRWPTRKHTTKRLTIEAINREAIDVAVKKLIERRELGEIEPLIIKK